MIGDAGDLPGEFTSMLEHLPLTSTARKELDDFRSFVSRNLGVLTDYPELVLPLALNQPADSTVMRHAAAAPSDSWMQCMNKAETEPAGKSNVPISNSACAALAVSADGTYLACGGDDWNVHVLLAKQVIFLSEGVLEHSLFVALGRASHGVLFVFFLALVFIFS